MRYIYLIIKDKDLEEIVRSCVESSLDDVNSKNLFVSVVTQCILRNLKPKK